MEKDNEYFTYRVYEIEDKIDELEGQLRKALGNDIRNIEHRFLDMALSLRRIKEFIDQEID